MQHFFAPNSFRRTLVAAASLSVVAGLLALGGCSRTEESSSAAPASAATAPANVSLDTYDRVAQQGKGFTVGPLMSANAVYVLFDPQCPHCGHLWQAAQPLLKKVKFVWVPVGIINAKSTSQGAALLTATNPAEAMSAHEVSLLSGSGGISASSSIPDDIEAALKTNTQVFNSLKVESVPMIVAKNATTGAVITHLGAMDTVALANFLGVSQP